MSRIIFKRRSAPVVTRPTREQVLNVAGNFCNIRDAAGRVVYTPALPGAPPAVFEDWLRLQRQAGSTHLPFGPVPGEAYPGIGWSNPDGYADSQWFRSLILRVLDSGFVPIVFLGGDTWDQSRHEQWPKLAKALDGLRQYLLIQVAWEPVVGGWTSKQLSQGLIEAHAAFPESVLGWHGSPTRWCGSSNPVEPDDPWQGAEAEFFMSHGGEHIDVAFYQTPHGAPIYTPCTCPNAAQPFGHRDECWLNRWEDGVARLGTGYHGWRRMAVCLYETVAYEFFRGQATSEQARQVARAGKTVSDKWGITVSYGNGLP